MRAGYNVRKRQILGLLGHWGPRTATEIADKVQISSMCASRLLGLYYKEGLLSRRKTNRFGEMRYELTPKGRVLVRKSKGAAPVKTDRIIK